MYKRTNIIIFILAVILMATAIYFIMSYVNNIKETYINIPMKSVVAAVQNIPENVTITDEMLKMVDVPADLVLPQAYDSIESIKGSITKTAIVKDEHILSNHIYKEGQGRDKFSYSVPENMRAVSISINDVSGVSGLIQPNDHVDILITFAYEENVESQGDEEDDKTIHMGTEELLIEEYLKMVSEELMRDKRIISIDAKEITLTMMQNVEVLAVYGSNYMNNEETENENRDSGTITLALDPHDVELLTNAETIGNIKLSLRSPVDGKIVKLNPITRMR